MNRSSLITLLLTLAGCGGGAPPPIPQSQQPNGVQPAIRLATFAPDGTLVGDYPHQGSHDAAPPLRELFRIDIYQFTTPLGSLGRNEEFWRQIDEQCVDVGTYDLLFKNGIRVGVAPMSEFAGIKKHIAADATCRSLSVTGTIAREVELTTQKDLIEQTIFHFDQQNHLIGRGYDRCTNLLNLSFEPTPRKPGSIRVHLCPMVRTNRTELTFSVLNDEREIQYVSPEMLYDLNMRVDIPPDTFFIIAPSSDADRPTSVGHAFLTQDGPTQRLEQVIVFVPRPLNASDPLAPPPPMPELANH